MLLTLTLWLMSQQESAEGITHSFLVTGGETYIVEADDRIVWQYPKSTRDGWALLNGRLLLAVSKGKEYPGCASCHQRMDPLGFAMENFDAIGAWRDKDGDAPIDALGELPSGEKFRGPKELRELLLSSRKQQFAHCLTEKLLTYALGRGVEYSDQCAVQKITAAMEKDGYRFSRLVVEMVSSDPFLKKSSRLTP